MDITMEHKSFNSYCEIFSGEKLCKLSADAVIPDTYDDISRLLVTEFNLKIISKDVSFGKITVSGEVQANTLFIPENSTKPESIITSIPFTADFAAENADSSSLAVASLKLIAADWRELNPRKIGVNVDILVEVKAFSRTEMNIPCEKPENCEGAFFKADTKHVKNISLVSEKLASIEDEHEIGGITSVVFGGTEFFCDSAELVGNKLILKGHTHSKILYRRDNGELDSLEYDTQFSQLFDHDENAEIADYECTMLTAGEYYEVNGSMLNMELRIVMQLVCYENREVTYVSDAYSCGCEYELVTDETEVTVDMESTVYTQNVQLSCELPENQRKICVTGASTGKMSLSGNTVVVPVTINALSFGDDNVYSFRVRGNAEFEDISCENLSAWTDSISCAIIGNRAEFEALVKLKGNCAVKERIAAVSAISVNVEVNKNISPSVIIARAESGDIWDIAKKYGADQNRVAEINALQDGEDIRGRMLLIPKV